MNSLTEENYLKALYLLSGENGEVSVNDLARALDIRMPTATSMIKKLADKKLVEYTSYKPPRLSDLGRLQAAAIIRKHRLTEMFLVEKMGFRWDEVHDIAEQMEHIHSALFFDRMDALLGHPAFDPHGSPIPDKQGNVSPPHYFPLSECACGDRVVFMAVRRSSEDFLQFLNGKGLALRMVIEVKSKEEFDGSMVLAYDGHAHENVSGRAVELMLVERYA
ncbi:MAG: hypothetical protein RL226_1698 [Bacteroidota bacterium]|jgi:DtxR family Mn-dependent transcriptional regulator